MNATKTTITRFELEAQTGSTLINGGAEHTGCKIHTSSPRKVCQILSDTARDGGRPWTVREWDGTAYRDLDDLDRAALKLEAYGYDVPVRPR